MKNTHAYIFAAVLFAIGSGVFAYKTMVVGLPLTTDEKTELWEVDALISFTAGKKPVILSYYLPQNTNRFAVVDQNFVSRGYGVSTSEKGVNRHAVLSIKKADGKQALYYRFTVLRGQPGTEEKSGDVPKVRRFTMTDVERNAAEGIIQQADNRSADTETFVVQVLQQLADTQPTGAATALLGRTPTALNKITAAAKIMGLARIPARRVHGILLGLDRSHAQFNHWLEVYDGKAWIPFLPDAKGAGIPDDYFPWWRGPNAFFSLSGGVDPLVNITVSRTKNLTLNMIRTIGEEARNPVLTWSLLGLPLQTQLVFRILLVVPLGVFLLILLRNVVGVKTFGTFMPVLIALAFRETGLVWGCVLFSVVVTGGLLVRLYLEHLKLLLVPRLGAVLIVVIMLMALFSLLSHKLDIVSGLSIALFPMVILTMTIERMSVVWDERGPTEALKDGLGSLLVAILCFFAMSDPAVEHLIFVFPELLFVILAMTVLLGRYSGYRFTELMRFRVLGERTD